MYLIIKFLHFPGCWTQVGLGLPFTAFSKFRRKKTWQGINRPCETKNRTRLGYSENILEWLLQRKWLSAPPPTSFLSSFPSPGAQRVILLTYIRHFWLKTELLESSKCRGGLFHWSFLIYQKTGSAKRENSWLLFTPSHFVSQGRLNSWQKRKLGLTPNPESRETLSQAISSFLRVHLSPLKIIYSWSKIAYSPLSLSLIMRYLSFNHLGFLWVSYFVWLPYILSFTFLSPINRLSDCFIDSNYQTFMEKNPFIVTSPSSQLKYL